MNNLLNLYRICTRLNIKISILDDLPPGWAKYLDSLLITDPLVRMIKEIKSHADFDDVFEEILEHEKIIAIHQARNASKPTKTRSRAKPIETTSPKKGKVNKTEKFFRGYLLITFTLLIITVLTVISMVNKDKSGTSLPITEEPLTIVSSEATEKQGELANLMTKEALTIPQTIKLFNLKTQVVNSTAAINQCSSDGATVRLGTDQNSPKADFSLPNGTQVTIIDVVISNYYTFEGQDACASNVRATVVAEILDKSTSDPNDLIRVTGTVHGSVVTSLSALPNITP